MVEVNGGTPPSYSALLAPGGTRDAETELVRRIGRWDLVALVLNAIIGAGIFGLPSRAFALAGTYSLLAYAVCAILVVLFILCFAEVGSRYSRTGGPYIYTREAFGVFAGFQIGWLLWIARLTAFASLSNLLVSYASIFWPPAASGVSRAAILTSAVLLLTILNIVGIKPSTLFTNGFAIGKLTALLVFIVVGLFFIVPQNYSGTTPPGGSQFSQTVLLLVFAFSGFEMAVIPAGEIVKPEKQIPFALLTSITIVVVLYILIQIVAIGTLPGLASSQRPLADAAAIFMGSGGAAFIAAGALVSIVGTLNTIALVSPRVLFAMADDNLLPRFFAMVHPRFRTPHISIVISSAVMLVLTLQGSFVASATISTVIRLVTYAATCAALLRLRSRPNIPAAPFVAPFGVAAAIAALALTAWLLSNTSWEEAMPAAIAAGAGVICFFLFQMAPEKRSAPSR